MAAGRSGCASCVLLSESLKPRVLWLLSHEMGTMMTLLDIGFGGKELRRLGEFGTESLPFSYLGL